MIDKCLTKVGLPRAWCVALTMIITIEETLYSTIPQFMSIIPGV